VVNAKYEGSPGIGFADTWLHRILFSKEKAERGSTVGNDNRITFEGLPNILLNSVSLGCACWDDQLRPVFCNEEMLKLFEAADESELFVYFAHAIEEGTWLDVSFLHKAFEEDNVNCECDIQTIQGKLIPTVVTLKRFEHDGNSFVLCSVRNMSGRAASRARIRETEDRLQILFDATPLAILYLKVLETDADGSLLNALPVDCNQEALKLFGFGKKEDYLASLHWLANSSKQSVPSIHEIFMRMAGTALVEGSVNFEWLYRDKYGNDLPLGVTVVKVKHNNKDMLACYALDLREVKNTMRNLLEADERTSVLLDAMPVCVNMFDRKLNCIDCNEEAARLFD
jgi:PAS domain-containing protein